METRMAFDRRRLLPPRDWYVRGTHPGTDVWRHARTSNTPRFPYWEGEGTACAEPGCGGHLTTYKLDPCDTGVSTSDMHISPSADATAGYSICDTCYAQEVIPLSQVVENVVSITTKRKPPSETGES